LAVYWGGGGGEGGTRGNRETQFDRKHQERARKTAKPVKMTGETQKNNGLQAITKPKVGYGEL